MLVGHVTKDGTIAGPRVLEHMVDTVLSFEGERSHQYRILRAMKNRFGGTDEIGVFAMEGAGADRGAQPVGPVPDPPRRAGQRHQRVPRDRGIAAGAGRDPGADVRLASGATPRRAAVGWDCGRLAMILAVLEARCGLSFATAEVYLNVAGGYRLTDPARRPRGRGGAGLGDVRAAGAERSGGARRDRAVRRNPPGRACRAAAQGIGQARIRDAPGRRRASRAARGCVSPNSRTCASWSIRFWGADSDSLKRYSWPGPQFASQTVNPRRSRSNRMRSEPSRGLLTTSRFRI